MTQNESFPETWCAMWSQEPALAHRLISDRGRQWSSRVTNLDGVVGPGPAESFIADYAEQVGNRFRPRTLVTDGDVVAYTWDLTRRNGGIVSGADFNVLNNGKVIDNWTFATDERDQREDPTGTGPASEAGLTELIRTETERLRRTVHRTPAIDLVRGTAAYLWTPQDGGPGGIDFLAVRDGQITWASSIAAVRPFQY